MANRTLLGLAAVLFALTVLLRAPASWLIGPSTFTLVGVMVVALACSWNPGASA